MEKEMCQYAQRANLQFSSECVHVMGWAVLQHQHEQSYCFILRGAGCYWIVLHQLGDFSFQRCAVWCEVGLTQSHTEEGRRKTSEMEREGHVHMRVALIGFWSVATAASVWCLFIKMEMSLLLESAGGDGWWVGVRSRSFFFSCTLTLNYCLLCWVVWLFIKVIIIQHIATP